MPLRPVRPCLLALAFALAACTDGAVPSPPEPLLPPEPAHDAAALSTKPNVILILTDDQDARSLESMPLVKRHLVKKGTTFPRFILSFPLCCPSRVTYLRGQYAKNHGVIGNAGELGGIRGYRRADVERDNLATWLQGAGYRTGMMGKFMNEQFEFGALYRAPGWDDWLATDQAYFHYTVNDNGVLRRMGGQASEYNTDVLARRAETFIRASSAADKPFFLYVAPVAPHDERRVLTRSDGTMYHAPPVPAPRHLGAFGHYAFPKPPSYDEADMSDKPRALQSRPRLTAEHLSEFTTAYQRRLESLQAVDELVDRVMRTLAETGELENTYVFYASDNGWHMGEHRLTAGKKELIEEDIRVPMIVRGPGVRPGATIWELVGNIDFAPTVADLAGVPAPSYVDGVSIRPYFAGNPLPFNRRALLVEIWNRDGRLRTSGVRSVSHLYTVDWNNVREFYDLRTDPYQLNSLHATARKEDLARYGQWLADLQRCAGATCRAAEAPH